MTTQNQIDEIARVNRIIDALMTEDVMVSSKQYNGLRESLIDDVITDRIDQVELWTRLNSIPLTEA